MEKYVLILVLCANIATAILPWRGGGIGPVIRPGGFNPKRPPFITPPISITSVGTTTSTHSTLTVYKPMAANIIANLSEFETTIYSKVASENIGQNIVIAPYFISAAMVLLLTGANGSTLTELKNGLLLPESNKIDLTKRYFNTLSPLENNHQLSILNGMFIGNNFDIQQSYTLVGATDFFTNVTNINFAHTKKAVNSINSWAASKTNGRIKNVVNSQFLNQNDKMVLVNAVYYQGIWKSAIHKSDTRMQKFYSNDLCHHSNAQNVEMMFTQSNFNYGNLSSLEAEVIELPLWNSQLTMAIILPWKCGGLSALEDKLTQLGLSSLENKLNRGEFMINATFPKFEIVFNESLKDALTSMNMGGIFSKGANFDGIIETTGKSIKVNDVIHKTIIKVNEGGPPGVGSETCNRCVNSETPFGKTKSLTVDHPFVFMVRKFSNIILMGRYVN